MHKVFFFNGPPTTRIYTLSLHDALPIFRPDRARLRLQPGGDDHDGEGDEGRRSEEHTSELQSRQYLVCRLLLEKKNSQAIPQVLSKRRSFGSISPEERIIVGWLEARHFE